MPPDDRLERDLLAHTRDPRDGVREQLRVETDAMLSPKEKRGVANLIARSVKWTLEKAGLA